MEMVVKQLQKKLAHKKKKLKASFFDKTTDIMGFVCETGNLYMLLYFRSVYVNIDWIDDFKVRNTAFLATTDKTKRIVILK